jgi:hypothetical protein
MHFAYKIETYCLVIDGSGFMILIIIYNYLVSVCPKTSQTVISNGCERSVVQSLQHKQISPFSRNDNKKGFRTDTSYELSRNQ